DHVTGAVGEPQPQRVAVELDRRRHVAREHEDVREPARTHDRLAAAARRAGDAGGARNALVGRLLVRRGFLGHADLDRSAVGVAEPEAVRLRARRRIDAPDPQRVKPLAEARQVVLKSTERYELQLLARALDDGAPAVGVAVGVDVEPSALLAQ